jgi:hypothetical protein
MHSLELNLILVFMYMAGKKRGVLPKDILIAASNNKIGFLTAHKKYYHLQ